MESSVSLTVTLQAEHADLGSLERAVAAALTQVGQALWRHLLDLVEAAVPIPERCGCGAPVKANGRAPRRLVTLAGEVQLRRRRFRCTRCGAERVPLDEALGLEARTQHSLGVRERALWLVTELSYARTAQTLDELRGIAVSRGELHRWVGEEGARLEAAQDAEAEALLGEHPRRRRDGPRRGTVWVSADGTMLHDRASGSAFETTVGLVFEGTARTGRSRRALTGRVYVGGTRSWTSFAERFTATCARLGVFDAERVFFVSDGAAALRWIRERSFPDAIELLDWYHLVDALRGAIGPARPDRLERALALARPGDATGLLEQLEAWAQEDAPRDAERAARLQGVGLYVAHNRRAIEHYAIVPLASSGPMEKGVDLVVARRFKRRGMSWLRAGAGALLQLRLLRLNGTWMAYWAERLRAAQLPWPVAA